MNLSINKKNARSISTRRKRPVTQLRAFKTTGRSLYDHPDCTIPRLPRTLAGIPNGTPCPWVGFERCRAPRNFSGAGRFVPKLAQAIRLCRRRNQRDEQRCDSGSRSHTLLHVRSLSNRHACVQHAILIVSNMLTLVNEIMF